MSKSHPSRSNASQPHSSANASGEAEPSSRFRHLAPKTQPNSVHEISEAIYHQFTRGGESTELKFRLSGCLIDPVPFVQLASGEYRLLDGQDVSIQHADSLGLKQLVPLEQPPGLWTTPKNREKYCQQLDALAEKVQLAKAADGKQEIAWCHHVHGTLTAETDERSIEIPFSLWAARLAAGLDLCPAYHCPVIGIETYNLATDADGTITDADSIAVCTESNRRLLKIRMNECQLTGRLIDCELLMNCPIRNHWILKRLTKTCQGCFQSVDPRGLVRGRCESCRSLRKIKADDFRTNPVFAELIRQHTFLNQVQKIRLGTQQQHWLLQFQYLKKKWRVLFDRQSLRPGRVSGRDKWFRPWQEIDPKSWPAFLKKECD